MFLSFNPFDGQTAARDSKISRLNHNCLGESM